jgi:hypothetical protein
MFDANLDHLGLGTVDDPAWKMKDRQTSCLARALAVRAGLWGNHGYEAAYPMTYTDADGAGRRPAATTDEFVGRAASIPANRKLST